MALLFFDGFDHYNTAAMGEKWTTAGGSISAGNGRNGTQSLRDPIGAFKYLPNASGTTVICGASFKPRSAFSHAYYYFEICKDGSGDLDRQIYVRTTAGGAFEIESNFVTLGTSSFTMSLGTTYYIEFLCVLDDTAGFAQLKVDGTVVLTVTGVDTRGTGLTGWDGFRMTAGFVDVDDLYICDGSGTVNNDFLGDCTVETLVAQTDATAAGTNHGLTPSTGTDHGALVDDNPPNGDTDYNSGSTDGAKDTYQFPSMTSSGGIAGVQVLLETKKTQLITRMCTPVVRTQAVDYGADAVDTYTSYEYTRGLWEVSPATGVAWTKANVNAIEAGGGPTAT